VVSKEVTSAKQFSYEVDIAIVLQEAVVVHLYRLVVVRAQGQIKSKYHRYSLLCE
jgi:hypothetical protein